MPDEPTREDIPALSDDDLATYYRNRAAEHRAAAIESRKRADMAEATARHLRRSLSCPCLHTTPCDPYCTCRYPALSTGCRRCCSYGSPEQQKAVAELLVTKLEGFDAAAAEINRLRNFLKDIRTAASCGHNDTVLNDIEWTANQALGEVP